MRYINSYLVIILRLKNRGFVYLYKKCPLNIPSNSIRSYDGNIHERICILKTINWGAILSFMPQIFSEETQIQLPDMLTPLLHR